MGKGQQRGGSRSSSFIQDSATMSQLPKKLILDIKQEDIFQQQLQRHDHVHSQNSNPQSQALIQQQQRLRLQAEQQQLLQSMTPFQRAQLLQQHQLRQQLMQQESQPSSGVKRPYDSGVCSRRLMQYLYHQRLRPADNAIAYWRKFVAEYYAPRAKKRWCLALYENVGHNSLGVFPQAGPDAWQCDICGSKSGKGFEATYEVLPRLEEIKYASGVTDELLFPYLPREYRFPSGMMMLEYAKAVQESVFEQLSVVREGRLRIIFTPDLKILSWEFCARCHEEFLPRRLVVPQAKQLMQVAQKLQSTMSDSASDGASQQDSQATSSMVVTASRQLARSLGLPSLNELGFSKRYVRCLQIAEVVNSMKDLMNFCAELKVGPVEGLKKFSKNPSARMQKDQEMEQAEAAGLPTDDSALNRVAGCGGALSGSAQAAAALALTNHQTTANAGPTNPLTDPSLTPLDRSNQPGTASVLSGSQPLQQRQMQSAISSQQQQQQQKQLTNPQPSQLLQQQIIQQLMQDVNKHEQQSQSMLPAQKQCVKDHDLGYYGNFLSSTSSAMNPLVFPPERGNGFSSGAVNGVSPAPSSNVGVGLKTPDSPQILHLSDDFVGSFPRGFTDSGFFYDDIDDMNFNWDA